MHGQYGSSFIGPDLRLGVLVGLYNPDDAHLLDSRQNNVVSIEVHLLPPGAHRMALFTEENVARVGQWLKLRRLAFRFDRKTKVLCLLAFVIPGMMAVGAIWKVILAALFALSVFIVLPVFTGHQTLAVIRNRFGQDVADETMVWCEWGRYSSNKAFTIGDIQKELARRYDQSQAAE